MAVRCKLLATNNIKLSKSYRYVIEFSGEKATEYLT